MNKRHHDQLAGGATFWERSEEKAREYAQKAAELAERVTNTTAKKIAEKTNTQKGGATLEAWLEEDDSESDDDDDESEDSDYDGMTGGSSFNDYVTKGKAGIKKLKTSAAKGLTDASNAITEAQKLVGGSAEDHVRRDLDRQMLALQRGGREEWQKYISEMSGGGIVDDTVTSTKKVARKVEDTVKDSYLSIKKKMTGGAAPANGVVDDRLRADLAFQSTMLDSGGYAAWDNYMRGGGCTKKRGSK